MVVPGTRLHVVTIVHAFGSPAVSRYLGRWSVNGPSVNGGNLVILGRGYGVFVGFELVVDGFNTSKYVPLPLSHAYSTINRITRHVFFGSTLRVPTYNID